MGFSDANVIGQHLPSNEGKRHPDALFSDSMIHRVLIEPLLCRLCVHECDLLASGMSLVGYRSAATVGKAKNSHT